MTVWIIFAFVIGFVPLAFAGALAAVLLLSREGGEIALVALPSGLLGGVLGAVIIGTLIGAPFPFNGESHAEHGHETTSTAPAAAGSDDEKFFLALPCKACHTIDSLKSQGATGNVGPNLTHVGTAGATRKPGTSAAAYIRESILEPGTFVVPGFPNAMPPGLVPPGADLDRLVAFLVSHT